MLFLYLIFFIIIPVHPHWYDLQINFTLKRSFLENYFFIFQFFVIIIPGYSHSYYIQIIFM